MLTNNTFVTRFPNSKGWDVFCILEMHPKLHQAQEREIQFLSLSACLTYGGNVLVKCLADDFKAIRNESN